MVLSPELLLNTESTSEKQNVIVITGAGSGIGRATAIEFARKYESEGGAVIVCVGRRIAPLVETKELIQSHTIEALTISADVTKESDVEALFSEVIQKCGKVDVLFNNAGISAAAVPWADMEFKDWERVMAVNLNGVFLCMRAAMRVMRSRGGGRIINNGRCVPVLYS